MKQDVLRLPRHLRKVTFLKSFVLVLFLSKCNFYDYLWDSFVLGLLLTPLKIFEC